MCFVTGRNSALKQSNDDHVQGIKVSCRVKSVQHKSQKSSESTSRNT